MSKLISFFMGIIMFLLPWANVPETAVNEETMKTNYTYVFCHGLSGWGSYDIQNNVMPYWGMFGGSLMKYLNARGFNCVAASVAPQGSAWDRACELYAQLTGTRTDYGKEHSERCGHDRYGKDFSCKPLMKGWSAENKINLLGHSFGGVTVRLLAELMANGSEAERAATPVNDLSPLFAGGKADWIYSLTTLAAPTNGTTAYGLKADSAPDGSAEADTADHDMHIDNALALNEKISTLENVYYFAFSCSSTVKNEDGTYSADTSITESLFVSSANEMGALTGVTDGGFVIDETWLENDGLVNTVSARAPIGAPQKDFDESSIVPGVWNNMPVHIGDHMSLQGGLFKTGNVRQLYADLFNLINSL